MDHAPGFYAKIPYFYAHIFHSSSNVPVTYGVESCRLSLVRSQLQCARDARTRGESRETLVEKIFCWVCAWHYYGVPFIAPSQGPIPSLIMDPCPLGGWECKIRGSCRSMTEQLRLRYGCWPNHVRVKWVPRIFLPWVYSKSWSTTRALFQSFFPLRGKMDKNCVAHGSYYPSYPYFSSPIDPGACPFDDSCRYLRQHIQIWHWWWHQSGFSISLIW